jgi:hypothetical protein
LGDAGYPRAVRYGGRGGLGLAVSSAVPWWISMVLREEYEEGGEEALDQQLSGVLMET